MDDVFVYNVGDSYGDIFDGGAGESIAKRAKTSVNKITNQFSQYKSGFMTFGSNSYNSFISSIIILVLFMILVYKGNDSSWLSNNMNANINIFSTSFVAAIVLLMFAHIYFWTTEGITEGKSFKMAREVGFWFVGIAFFLTILSLPITVDSKEVALMYTFISISMVLLIIAYVLIRSTRTLYYITSLLIIDLLFLLAFIKF